MQDNEAKNLLWTGGWDSTFLLLKLLIIDRVYVQPYYLIDVNRKSLGIELKTMQTIKDKLFHLYPHTKNLLKPTQYYNVDDIKPDKEIQEAFEKIIAQRHFGSQYNWLSRFCKQFSITNMQMGMEKSEDPTIDGFFSGHYNRDNSMNTLKKDVMFQYFDFPILTLTKTDMQEISNKQGWSEIMNITWFCHTPLRNRQPCGRCKPCQVALLEGHSHRVPLLGKIHYYYHKLLIWPLKSLKRRKKSI